MTNELVWIFLIAFVISIIATPISKRLAIKLGAIDKPEQRKKNFRPISRLGGVAIMAGFLVPTLIFLDVNRRLGGLLAGILILLVLGVVDDIKNLRARFKLGWQVVASLAVLAGGIGIVFVTNPFGGIFGLDGWRIVVELGPIAFNILPLANLVSIVWIIGMINAVNLLDGLDGLAGGVSAIAALVLFVFAIAPATTDYTVAVLAMALLGALVGFIPYNFYPSTVFMGDSGSYTVGLILALLSIYSGSKVTIGVVVLGFALIDMIWVVSRRLLNRRSPFTADREHLHYRLVDSGLFSHRWAVIVLYSLSTLVAVTLLLAGGLAAFLMLILLLILLMSSLRILSPFRKRRL